MKFQGVYSAFITPFCGDQARDLDLGLVRELMEWQLEKDIDGFVMTGTTGEAPVITSTEREMLIKTAVEVAHHRVPVIIGTGTNSTASSIQNSLQAMEGGADAALVVTPYYNKPNQEGLIGHYLAIADAVELPILLYNIPSRTHVDLLPQTVAILAKHPNIIGIKEATALLPRLMEIRELCGSEFAIFSGDDFTAFPFSILGGDGLISVVSNVAPYETSMMWLESKSGNVEKARGLNQRLYPLLKALFVDTNPLGVKMALKLMGHGNGEVRKPLLPLSEEKELVVKKALFDFGII